MSKGPPSSVSTAEDDEPKATGTTGATGATTAATASKEPASSAKTHQTLAKSATKGESVATARITSAATAVGTSAVNDKLVLARKSKISKFGLVKLFIKKDLKLTVRYPIIPIIEFVLFAVILISFYYIVGFMNRKMDLESENLGNKKNITIMPNYLLNWFQTNDTLEPIKNMTKVHAHVIKRNNSFTYNAQIPATYDMEYGDNYFSPILEPLSTNYFEAYLASIEYLMQYGLHDFVLQKYTMDYSFVGVTEVNTSMEVSWYIEGIFLLLYVIMAIFSMFKIMQEKENDIHAYMIIMGLPRYCYYTCYFTICTLKIWISGLIMGCFVMSIKNVGLIIFFACFLFAHYIVYLAILITTLVNRLTFAVLLFVIIFGAQAALFFILSFTVYDGGPTTAVMFFQPLFAFYVIDANKQFVGQYNQPLHIFSESNFYIPIGPAFIALVWHIVIVVVLTFYLDYVFPVDSTQKLHPLFFLGIRKRMDMPPDLDLSTKPDSGYHEPVPESAISGIVINNLCKRWNNGEVALNHASFVALKNQVTGLLGHNGAGKSTIFGCLTGLHKPTSGQILFDVKETVGYCPQWDPIFPRFTVREHLHFYGTLKTGHKLTRKEVDDVIRAIGLLGSENTWACLLSTGQKRMLCVGMAIIGNSKVVILDEPTAGMDPMARHNMIGIIEGIQEGRTVLMTTHYMDEAETVSNRVIILSKGEVMCSGSLDFLKSKYSTGFMLTIVFTEIKMSAAQANVLAVQIVTLVKEECEQAMVHGSVGLQFSIHLPTDAQRSLPKIFTLLEENKTVFMIDTFGINVNSLEQVFLKVSEMADPEPAKDTQSTIVDVLTSISLERTSISNLPFQLMALFVRRFQYSRCHFFLSVIPYVLMILVTLFMLTSVGDLFKAHKDNTEVMDVIKNGPEMTILIHSFPGYHNALMLNGLKSYFDYPNVHVREFSDDIEIDDILYETMTTHPPLGFMFRLENDTHVSLVASNSFLLAPFVFMEAYTNNHPLGDSNMKFRITTTYDSALDIAGMKENIGQPLLNFLNLFVVYVITWPILLYTFEAQGAQHLYGLAKLASLSYWIFSCIIEMAFDLPVIIILLVVGLNTGAYTTNDIVIALPAHLLYLATYILQMFCVSKLFESGKLALTVIISFNFVGLIFLHLIHLTEKTLQVDLFVENIQYLFPSIGLTLKTSELAPKGLNVTVTTPNPSDNLKLTLDMSNIHNRLYSAAFYLILLIFMDFIFKNVSRVLRLCSETDNSSIKSFHQSNPDVEKEESKVAEAPRSANAVAAFHLRKTYFGFGKTKIAVQDLTFGIPQGEYFGLLGANGAGKSTTFAMLAGSITPTSGTAFVNGVNLASCCAAPEFGFCPQSNVVLDELTVEETFYLFSRLAGRVKTKLCVDAMINILKLDHVSRHKIKNCSGGEKRRVSVGVALLSDPVIVMLDEPTAGIDPRTRRRIWDLLIALRDQGSSGVLSSHSMEECETLCTKVGFLSKGVLRAIGTSQRLRHTFSDKYVLKIILSDATAVMTISNAVSARFPGTQLQDTNNVILTFGMPKKVKKAMSETPISKIYEELIAFVDEQNGKKDGIIKDYILVDTSLEQAFITTATNVRK